MKATLHSSLRRLLVSGPITLVLTAGFVAAQTALDEESPWPRVRTTNGHTVTLHQPQVEAWTSKVLQTCSRTGGARLRSALRVDHGAYLHRLAQYCRGRPNDIRTMLIGALGCNLAWGIIDGVFYLMGCLAEKSRNLMTYPATVAPPARLDPATLPGRGDAPPQS